jgi:hypothetical protein
MAEAEADPPQRPLSRDELAGEQASALPDREAMSLIGHLFPDYDIQPPIDLGTAVAGPLNPDGEPAMADPQASVDPATLSEVVAEGPAETQMVEPAPET